ncbi:primosomal protein N' [Lactobacillus sp. DCY120]|uniref:Replication restart protein PriA n=1 Tax=Bombilactobacillus apium TaxID=2675299 RepID=A0A850R8B6_9LACO|nr:primosomal protein N' [Bombilactobacillus apium]NVY96962.1 primosomal protein N' [Bombilactobacillus apium]
MYAQVVVDVPTQQTNHSYDYLIPELLESVVVPGVRVVVPFGRGKRLVVGFVIQVLETSQFKRQVKPIHHVLDLTPVLNSELLALSSWLTQESFSFWISCLQTMLPGVMRSKVEKVAVAQTSAIQASSLFQGRPIIPFPTTALAQQQLAKWKNQGLIEVNYQVANQAHHRQQLVLKRKSLNYQELLMTLSGRASKQQQLMQFFWDHPQLKQISYQELEQKYQISAATANTLVKRGYFTKDKVVQWRQPDTGPIVNTQARTLTAQQQQAYQTIIQAQAKPILLEGVTGSGKTEIYLQAMQYFLQQGKTALMLVPEISLTPQMVAQVQGRFGSRVAVLHSGLSQGERYDEWQRIQLGQATVVVGARSAVFAPLKNLGIIVIDEEHESSYKQEDNPRYHARSVALWRGRYAHCPVVLGSATPSLESRARGQKKLYQLVQLTQRVHQQPLPPVQIVDLRESYNLSVQLDLSQPLIQNLQFCLQKKEQAILLLNRRGFSNFLLCRTCGQVPQCPNCDISLTVHLQNKQLLCHYCGYHCAIPQKCDHCGSRKLRFSGTGTEKVEQELQEALPSARIIRMDNDTTARKGSHRRLLNRFGQQEADILLGTQMIAKGLDFPNVTLVGVINADTGLASSDFRASERTFQLLTQVSGRAGRDQKPGRVVIQTYNPDNYAIQLAARQDYERFYQKEMNFRHQAQYPPYFYLIKLTISHRQRAAALKLAYQLAQQIKPVLQKREVLLGPTEPTVARIKNRYYYQLVVKYRQNPPLLQLIRQITNNVQVESRHGYLVSIDNEPQKME